MKNAECRVRNGGGDLLVRASGLDGCYDYGEDFVGFGFEVGQTRFFHGFRTRKDLEPVEDFVALFQDDTHFGNEISTRFCAAGCPVVGADGSAATYELPGDNISDAGFGQRFGETENPQSQVHGPFFHVVKWHRRIMELLRDKGNPLDDSAFCILQSAFEHGRN